MEYPQFICISSEAWGKGKTALRAKRIAKQHHGSTYGFYFALYKCGPTARVNENGALVYSPAKDVKPELIEEVLP